MHRLMLLILLLPLSVIHVDSRETFVVDGLERSYVLHVPYNIHPEEPVPLLIVMHGRGGSAHQMQRYTRFDPIADREGFIVVYPQGIGDRWNDGRVFLDAPQVDDTRFMSLLIDHLLETYNIDPKRIYATGISNGGMMSYRLACELSDRIAGIASVTANMPVDLEPVCKPTDPLKVLVINGTSDPLIPYDGGVIRSRYFGPPRGVVRSTSETMDFWMLHNQCAANPVITLEPDVNIWDRSHIEAISYVGCDAPVRLLRVVGGGHTWPGTSQSQLTALIGRVNYDIHASIVIWEFFSAD